MNIHALKVNITDVENSVENVENPSAPRKRAVEKRDGNLDKKMYKACQNNFLFSGRRENF